jgi:hypothetical protein
MSEPIQRYRGGLLIRPSLPTDAVQGEFVTYADALAWVQREVEKTRAEGTRIHGGNLLDTYARGLERGQRDERQRIKDGVLGIYGPGATGQQRDTPAPKLRAVLAVIDGTERSEG